MKLILIFVGMGVHYAVIIMMISIICMLYHGNVKWIFCFCSDSDRILAWHFNIPWSGLSSSSQMHTSLHPVDRCRWFECHVFRSYAINFSYDFVWFLFMAERCYTLLLLLCSWSTDRNCFCFRLMSSHFQLSYVYASCVGECIYKFIV